MKKELWNEGWKFWKDRNAFELLTVVPKDALTVELPYDALIREEQKEDSVNQGRVGFLDGGVYNYYKELELPEESEGRILLEFGGVFTRTVVYVNGSAAAENKYPYQHFYADLTDYLIPGEKNKILVVANAMDLTSRYYTGAGIFRDVYLCQEGLVSIVPDSVRVTVTALDEEGAAVQIDASVKNEKVQAVDTGIRAEISQDGQSLMDVSLPILLHGGKTTHVMAKGYLKGVRTWSADTPELCSVKFSVSDKKGELDAETFETGIRTIAVDSVHGLRINGKEEKLRGACIHHDTGLLGAETYYDYEYRRVRRLKEAGFNAVRSAHNPASRELLTACDRLGMYIMDEGFDMWNKMKNYADFAGDFETGWEKVLKAMVDLDYNHPSVILYSTGNEISDIGTEKGFDTSRKLTDFLHSEDGTRPVTNGINGLFAAGSYLPEMLQDLLGDRYKALESGDINEGMAMVGEKMGEIVLHKRVSEVIDRLESTMDILGYNYMTACYLPDHEKHSQRVMVGSETFPPQIAENWEIITHCPAVIGDFTWTGYGYLGETGVYPAIINNAGDLTVAGRRTETSYYRELVFGKTTKPYLAVVAPETYEIRNQKSPWEFTKAKHSWTYPGKEGEITSVEVYSAGDEVELYLNDKLIGKEKNGQRLGFLTEFTVPYEAGKLKAVSLKNGKILSECELETVGEAVSMEAETESYENFPENRGLRFVDLRLLDEKGRLVYGAENEVHVELEGDGRLLAFGSAHSKHRKGYAYGSARPEGGELLAIVKKGKGALKLRFKGEGLKETEVQL